MKFNRKFILLLIFSLNCYHLKSTEIDFDFNGYLYNLPNIQKFPESFSLYGVQSGNKDYIAANISRLRLKPTINIGMNTEISAHYEINSLWSDYQFPVFENQGIGIRQAVDLNWEIANEDKFKMNHYIDRLYWKQFFDFGEMVIGRQRISWGVGRVWQLTDLFNPINPANFSKFEKDGADAISAKIYTGNFSDIEAVVNFRETNDKYNYGWRYRTNYAEYDFSVIGGFFDKRYIVGAELAGNLFDAGVRGELIFSADENDFNNNYTKYLVGIDYQFTDKLYALIEYKHNGQGTDCKLCYEMDKLFSGKILNVGLDYGATQVTYQIHPLVSANIMNIINLRDKSGFSSVGISYEAFQNLMLNLSGMYFYGDELTEYRFYSTTAYLTIEWYF